jgi:hypothetical protein
MEAASAHLRTDRHRMLGALERVREALTIVITVATVALLVRGE